MTPRPWRPAGELEQALDRGDLRYAVALAEELRLERGRPIELETAARFLPLIAAASPGEYDAYALRWLARWVAESGTATIEQAAEIAASLADLPVEPGMLDAITATL
jgi:catalase (peroxidase I)